MSIKKSIVGIMLGATILVNCGITPVSALTQYTTTANLSLRKYASTSSTKLATIPYGTKITPITIYNNWAKITYKNRTGWSSMQYLAKATTVVNGKVVRRLVIVDKQNLVVTLYNNGRVNSYYKCAIGKASTPTPNGKFSIINKQMNRPYYKKGIPGGAKNNPLGTRFLQLTSSGYAIHGTNNPYSIGGRVSNGCVRLTNYNVEKLYSQVYLGDIVLIGSGRDEFIASKYGYKIYR